MESVLKRIFYLILSFCVSIYCPLIWSQWSQDPLDNVIITDTIIRTLDNNKVKTEEPDTVGLDPSSKELIISLQEMEDGRFLAFKREGLQTAELDTSNKQALEEIQQVLLSYLESRSGEEQIKPVSPQDIMEFFKANGFELTLVEGDHPGRINPEDDNANTFIIGGMVITVIGFIIVLVAVASMPLTATGVSIGEGIALAAGGTSVVGGIYTAFSAASEKADVKIHDRSIGKEVEEEIITALQTAIKHWWDHQGLEGEPSFSEAFGVVTESF